MPSSLPLLLLPALLATCAPGTTTAPASPAAIPDSAGYFSLSPDSALAVFPIVPLPRLGCSEANVGPQPDGARVFSWAVALSFPDADSFVVHAVAFDARFRLRTGADLSPARLDSALQTLSIHVRESAGEPPLPVATVLATGSRATFTGGRVTLTVRGDSGLAMLLRTGAREASLIWCEVDKLIAYRTVPLSLPR